MFALALRSLRQRPGRATATLLSAFLGAAVVMTFNSLHDTAARPGVDSVSAESLSTAAGVVGGYGTLLVFFAIASTLTVNVRQRGAEMELLRCSGATPAQIRRMVVGEAVAIALVGAVLAIGPAMLGGRALLGVFDAPCWASSRTAARSPGPSTTPSVPSPSDRASPSRCRPRRARRSSRCGG